VQRLDDVYLYNIDDLNTNVRHREGELVLCNRIIETQAGTLFEKLNSGKERLYEIGFQF
jgi:glutamyl-tRNA reductase